MVGIKGKSGVYDRTEYHRRICSKSSKGRKPWNKGLTKETDERVKRGSFLSSITIKNLIANEKINPTKNFGDYAKPGKFIGNKNPFYGKKHSEKSKEKISENSGMKNSESRIKLSNTLKLMFKEKKLFSSMLNKNHSNLTKEKISKSIKNLIKEGKLKFKIEGQGNTTVSVQFRKGSTSDSNIVSSESSQDILGQVTNLEISIK